MMNDEQEPSPEVRRRLIEQKRDSLRAAGFDATLEAISLNAQRVEGAMEERERVKGVKDLKAKAVNAYLGAKELDEMLKALPEPEKTEA